MGSLQAKMTEARMASRLHAFVDGSADVELPPQSSTPTEAETRGAENGGEQRKSRKSSRRHSVSGDGAMISAPPERFAELPGARWVELEVAKGQSKLLVLP